MKIKALALLTCTVAGLFLSSCAKKTPEPKASNEATSGKNVSSSEDPNSEKNSSTSEIPRGSSDESADSFGTSGIFLNSVLELNLLDHDSEDVRNEVFSYLSDFERKLSLNISESQISEINRNAGLSPVPVDDEVFYLIEKSLHYAKLSRGAFDITIAPVAALWGIGTKEEGIPSSEQLSSALSSVNYQNIVLDKNNKTVFLKEKGMAIDLGGIAKGYAADKIKEILERHGVTSAIINLGGNIIVHGKKKGGPFKLGLQKPFGRPDEYIAVLKTSDRTVVTSGNYERYFMQNGKIYHHILSPETGQPIDNELDAAVIIADSSVDSDALSTAVFSLGRKEGQALVDTLDNVEAIFITKDHKIYAGKEMKKNLTLTDESYTLVD